MKDIGEDALFLPVEQRVAVFLEQLGRLPAFRPELGRSARQGDLTSVREASDAWLSMKVPLERRPELIKKVYSDPRWANYRKLLEHSTPFVKAQKKRDAERYKRQATPATKAERAEKEKRRRKLSWLAEVEAGMMAEIRELGLTERHEHILAALRKRFEGETEKIYLGLQLKAAAEVDSPLLPAIFEEVRKRYPKTTWAQVEQLRDEAKARRAVLN